MQEVIGTALTPNLILLIIIITSLKTGVMMLNFQLLSQE